ncbi:uncharacterized protein A1O9_02293 [Exophiala aquamarina CBS 119918]|uniref:SCP domain-containing protein n=1 Tax=Exophiala aquamarina CBS 119918 TaxID=1182545 RepID=A0A072PLX2_9EURO|nr:uncharacterized protein A1O9_02293 [Exophiala aquamarina CBS 119918]KEF60732.1 hypothetical protein A1O9_02293 [Exophiala aquamarina CBS 119918]
MYALKTLSVLAIAATTVFAAPTPAENGALEARQWRGGNRYWNRPDSNAEVTTYAYGGDSPAETPAPAAPQTWGAPSSAPATPAPSAPATPGGGGDWLDIANKWRVAGGKPAFTESSTLVANAQKTADDSVGGLQHQLNPGTMAQVLAPGDASDFETVYLGGWLCELPNSPGLDGICASASNGWNHEGQTGHAEILTGDYKSIGCAFSSGTGVWSCDLA